MGNNVLPMFRGNIETRRCKCGGEIKEVFVGSNGKACYEGCANLGCQAPIFHIKADSHGRKKKVVLLPPCKLPEWVAVNLDIVRIVTAQNRASL